MATPVTAIMTTDVLTLLPETSIQDAVRQLTERGISGAPVVDADGLYVGLLDDTDLILSEARLHAPTTVELLGAYLTLPGEQRRYEEELKHALGRTAGEVMETDARTLTAEATVEDAATIILDTDRSRVPILDAEGRVVGIVTRGDLVKALYRPADESA